MTPVIRRAPTLAVPNLAAATWQGARHFIAHLASLAEREMIQRDRRKVERRITAPRFSAIDDQIGSWYRLASQTGLTTWMVHVNTVGAFAAEYPDLAGLALPRATAAGDLDSGRFRHLKDRTFFPCPSNDLA